MMTTLKKKAVAAGLVAGMTAGLGAGLLLEVSGTAGASSTAVESTTADATDDTADSRAERRAARLQEVLAPLVEAGTITQAQADAVIAALAEAAPEFEGRHGRHGGHGDRRGAGMIGVVVDTLGMTFEDLRTAVADGQTLAEIAAANGSSGEELIAALVERLEIRLADHVADGELTEAEAAERLADATAKITEFVNDTPSLDEFGRHGH